ncbi:MAG: hypothetical protein JWO42_3362 [Chloroflexi bacterium]|nr:hypothetical protein [Chloroflexota bacterium]
MFWKRNVSQALITVTAIAATAIGIAPQSVHGARAASPDQITYTYTYFNPSAPRDQAAVQDAINAITIKAINTRVTLNPIPFSSFDQKMKLTFAAGQPCDIVFTAPWSNNFYNLVTNGDLLPLGTLLQKYAPKTYASMPAAAWNAAKVAGQIYGVINQQLFPKTWGILVRQDLATKYHINLSSVHKLDDITPILAKLKSVSPGIIPLSTDDAAAGVVYQPETYGLDPLVGGSQNVYVAAVGASDKTLKVVDPSETPAFQHAIQVAWHWHQAGYTTKDLTPNQQALANFRAGKFAAALDQARPSAAEAAKNTAQYGYVMAAQSFTKALLTTAAVNATMSGICRTSAHPAAAMKFLELLNTNPQVYGLMTHGIQGKDYVYTDKANDVIAPPSGQTTTTDGYWPNTDWMFGNQFLAPYTDKNQIGSWAIQKKANLSAIPSIALGFSVDTSKVKTQLAQVTAAIQQYGEPLVKGLVDPATGYPKLVHALKAAGEDQILANVQAQIKAWAAKNKAKNK